MLSPHAYAPSNTRNATGVDSDDSLMSARQTSKLIGVSLVTLSRWRSEGRGPPFARLSASRVAYPVREYREWVRARTAECGVSANAA